MPIVLKIANPLPITAPGKGSNLVGGVFGVRDEGTSGSGASDTPGTGAGVEFSGGEPTQTGGADTDLVMHEPGADPTADGAPLRTSGVEIRLGNAGGGGPNRTPIGLHCHWPARKDPEGAFGADQKILDPDALGGGDPHGYPSLDQVHEIGVRISHGNTMIPSLFRWLYPFHPTGSRDDLDGNYEKQARWFRPFVNAFRFFRGPGSGIEWTVDWYDPLPATPTAFGEYYGTYPDDLNPYAPAGQSIPVPAIADLEADPASYGFTKVPVLSGGADQWGQVVIDSKTVESDVTDDPTYVVPKLALPLFVFLTDEQAYVFIPYTSNVRAPVVYQSAALGGDGEPSSARVCGYPLMTDGILVIKGDAGAVSSSAGMAFLRYLDEPCVINPVLSATTDLDGVDPNITGAPVVICAWIVTITGICWEFVEWAVDFYFPGPPYTTLFGPGYYAVLGPNSIVVATTSGSSMNRVTATVDGVDYTIDLLCEI